jgi:hypothetical protein
MVNLAAPNFVEKFASLGKSSTGKLPHRQVSLRSIYIPPTLEVLIAELEKEWIQLDPILLVATKEMLPETESVLPVRFREKELFVTIRMLAV